MEKDNPLCVAENMNASLTVYRVYALQVYVSNLYITPRYICVKYMTAGIMGWEVK